MLIRQGFQYALRLKAQGEAVLRRWAGCRRFVFNEALAHQKAEAAAGRKRPGYAALCARLPELKKLHPWLCDPPAQALQTERELEVGVPAATATAVGLDFGAATTIMPSAGAPIELPARIGRHERPMKRLQQSVSRKNRALPTGRRRWPGSTPATAASRRCDGTSCTSAPQNWLRSNALLAIEGWGDRPFRAD